MNTVYSFLEGTGYLMYPILKIYEMDNNKQLIITKSRIIVFYINQKANFQKYISLFGSWRLFLRNTDQHLTKISE